MKTLNNLPSSTIMTIMCVCMYTHMCIGPKQICWCSTSNTTRSILVEIHQICVYPKLSGKKGIWAHNSSGMSFLPPLDKPSLLGHTNPVEPTSLRYSQGVDLQLVTASSLAEPRPICMAHTRVGAWKAATYSQWLLTNHHWPLLTIINDLSTIISHY